MRPVRQSTAGISNTPVIPLDLFCNPFSVSLAAIVTGAATYTAEYTLDDVWAPGYNPDAVTSSWFPLVGMTAAAVTANATLVSPVVAVRLRQTAGAGSVVFQVVQSGLNP